jgi:hypothetical protein
MSVPTDEMALRKRMLMVRAALERSELSSQWHQARGVGTVASVARWLLPTMLARRSLPFAIDLLRRFPAIGQGAALAARGLTRERVVRALRWGALCIAIWQTTRIALDIRKGRRRARNGQVS